LCILQRIRGGWVYGQRVPHGSGINEK
jgi:hypothetical protein